jgi:hypothetical protein
MVMHWQRTVHTRQTFTPLLITLKIIKHIASMGKSPRPYQEYPTYIEKVGVSLLSNRRYSHRKNDKGWLSLIWTYLQFQNIFLSFEGYS